MLSNTLTSLAILRVQTDLGNDYLDYLRPFIMHVLVEYDPIPIIAEAVTGLIRDDFGLIIPDRAIEIVLRRIAKQQPIERVAGVYERRGTLDDPQIRAKQVDAQRHIQAVISDLKNFSSRTARPFQDETATVAAICDFLAEFDVSCLRAYLRGTTIPSEGPVDRSEIVLISEYVDHIQSTNPERFKSFMVLVQGHMLANALLCPDIDNATSNFRQVIFYLDTPLLIHLLGAEGDPLQKAAKELVDLLKKLRAKVATFSHCRDELQSVFRGAANHLESPAGRGAIVLEARKIGRSRSDLILFAESVDEQLRDAGVEVIRTPRYTADIQIDETAFEQVLDDEISYFNPRAREIDINSVRSIYVLRGETFAPSLEKSKAVLVTSNVAFAKAAWEYGKDYDQSRHVSSVIADFTLANLAWLKAPMGAPDVPTTQLLAFSYASQQPTAGLWNKYLNEIDRLKTQGTITQRDHELLRSSPFVQKELMELTLGMEDSLDEATITETLGRVSDEIRQEGADSLAAERWAHDETRRILDSAIRNNEAMAKAIYWRCDNIASRLAWVPSILFTTVLLVLLVLSLGLWRTTPAIAIISASGLTVVTALSVLFGFNVRDSHTWFTKTIHSRLFGIIGREHTRDIGALIEN